MEFLVLGAKQCKFCDCAKALLEDECIPYQYIDLGEDWRSVFKEPDIAKLGTKSIPLIFTRAVGGTALKYAPGEWMFIGGFDDLRKKSLSW